MILRNLFIAATLVALQRPAAADDPPSFDADTRTAIQSVITKQLDAFQHDDAKAAEDFATPALQKKFPEPSKFFDMVKQNYAALIRPRHTQFGETAASPHGPLQKMTVVAADGTVWDAIYSFEKIDGQWRISGCGIEKKNEQAI